MRQYDITDPMKPKLKGQLFLGGVANRKPNVRIVNDPELDYEPKPVFKNGRRLEGAPQMLQLSLDGKRLYVSSSLYSPWDRQVRVFSNYFDLAIDNVYDRESKLTLIKKSNKKCCSTDYFLF